MNYRMKSELKSKPWLQPFIEDGDEDLGPAKERWREAVDLAIRQLEEMGVEVHQRMRTESGLETTALVVSQREAR